MTKFTHLQSQTTHPNINYYAQFEENLSRNAQDREQKRSGDGRTLLQLDTCWVLTVLEKVAKKA